MESCKIDGIIPDKMKPVVEKIKKWMLDNLRPAIQKPRNKELFSIHVIESEETSTISWVMIETYILSLDMRMLSKINNVIQSGIDGYKIDVGATASDEKTDHFEDLMIFDIDVKCQ